MTRVAIITTDNREHDRDYKNPMPYFGTAPEALLQGLAQMPDVEVHVVSCLQRSVSSPAKLAPNTCYHGLHVPNMGWMKTVYQGCIRAVRKKIQEIQPDIVHGQGTERYCALSAVFSGFPSVLTIHGNMRLIAQVNRARPFTFQWLASQLEKITIPRSRGVVCITNYTRDAVRDLARRTWVVPNAVDQKFFEVQPDENHRKTILCVGHVCLRKNQNNFIRSLDPLATKIEFKVIFLGGVNREQSYGKEFFELVSARPWCDYGGFADRDKLKAYFQKATLLALPSLEDNCPMVVLEAMAAGVPVVAANVGGVPDLIEEGKTGLFCDPLNSGSMKDGVAKLLNEPEAAKTMAALAKQRAKERFHPLVIARRHLEIYREVLSKSS